MSEFWALVLGVCGVLGTLLYGYRNVPLWRAYRSIGANDAGGTAGIYDGNEATVEGTVVVDEPVSAGEETDQIGGSTGRPALAVWRVRRGETHSSFDETIGASRKWDTKESGIDASEFRIDDGSRDIRVDPTWLADRYGGAELASLEPANLDGQGPWSKWAWNSPYADVSAHRDEFTLDERNGLPPATRAELEGDLDRYQLQSRLVPEGASLTVHGRIDVDRGTPVIRGTDRVPLAVSDRGPDALASRLESRMLKSAVYGAVMLSASLGLLYVGVGPMSP